MESEKLQAMVEPVALDEIVGQHIQRVLAQYNGNISAAARALRMHRRTLQRKLARLRRGEGASEA